MTVEEKLREALDSFKRGEGSQLRVEALISKAIQMGIEAERTRCKQIALEVEEESKGLIETTTGHEQDYHRGRGLGAGYIAQKIQNGKEEREEVKE
jgi:hypothetical protein